MRRALRGREHSNWVISCNLDDEQIWHVVQKGLVDESILVTLIRQLPYGKWLAGDHYGRWFVVADEHLVREWIGSMPT